MACELRFCGCALGQIRTADTRFRRAVLYPLSYEGLACARIPQADPLARHAPGKGSPRHTSAHSRQATQRGDLERRAGFTAYPGLNVLSLTGTYVTVGRRRPDKALCSRNSKSR